MFSTQKDGDIVKVTLGGELLNLELAKSTEATIQGLSYRQQIPADGMLFVFPEAELRYFWMKEMNFPLDIIWLRDNIIVSITYNAVIPPKTERAFPTVNYDSKLPANMVIEVEAGRAVSFAVGMKLEILN